MKKIVFYSDSAEFGGAEKYLVDLINKLDRAKYRSICVLPKNKNSFKFRGKINNTKIYELSRPRIWLGLTGILMKEKPDIVHLNMHVPFSCFFAILASKLTKVHGLLATVHSVVPPASRSLLLKFIKHRLSNLLLTKIDAFICVSRNSKEMFAENYKIDNDKISVVYNGIDMSDAEGSDAAGLKKQLGINGRDRIVGVVSRIVKDKGVDDFLRASKKVLASCPDTTFLIAGDGYLGDKMKDLSVSLGISKKVVFAGEVKDVFSHINIMDICVMPSRHESMPYVILEYIAMGKPAIASKVGGIPEVLDDGVNGILFEPKDIDKLAQKAVELLDNKEKALEISRNAKIKSDEYTIEKMIERTINVYESIESPIIIKESINEE
ncbi:MAG: glycosyltransferase family 4 protein [Candidatus Saganbacteria bacterium]|nr:glycosyltransferase family 4 protein [Candidatus Saganbacteria bacterium]